MSDKSEKMEYLYNIARSENPLASDLELAKRTQQLRYVIARLIGATSAKDIHDLPMEVFQDYADKAAQQKVKAYKKDAYDVMCEKFLQDLKTGRVEKDNATDICDPIRRTIPLKLKLQAKADSGEIRQETVNALWNLKMR